MTDTPRERALQALAQAETRADNGEAIGSIRAARRAVEAMGPTPLAECEQCGRVAPKPTIDRGRCH
jgi:uncharacterized Zn finger protein